MKIDVNTEHLLIRNNFIFIFVYSFCRMRESCPSVDVKPSSKITLKRPLFVRHFMRMTYWLNYRWNFCSKPISSGEPLIYTCPYCPLSILPLYFNCLVCCWYVGLSLLWPGDRGWAEWGSGLNSWHLPLGRAPAPAIQQLSTDIIVFYWFEV